MKTFNDILKAVIPGYNTTLREWMIHHQRTIVGKCSWKGIPTLKNPVDMWVYQQLLNIVKPDVILEIGALHGGSTQFFADIFDNKVISVDIDRSEYCAKAPNLIDITGDSHSPDIVNEVKRLCRGKVIVFHDGDHHKESVSKDLELYSPLVDVGSYFVVEDTTADLFSPDEHLGTDFDGPLHAVLEFVKDNKDFIIDEGCNLYPTSYAIFGFLRRIDGEDK